MAEQHWMAKANIRDTKWVSENAEAGSGEVRLKLDAFALTANNVTYAAFGGEPMKYWDFFPASNPSYGRVPVWGFATVETSNVDGIEPGRRVYGYFPISSHLVVQPTRLSKTGFSDGAAHRQALAPVYNTYIFTDTDPIYVADREAEQMLFRPLYMTGWMIVDSLMNGKTPPKTVIISSASSKTALATAHGLHRQGVTVIGLTSPANVDFVKGAGLYSDVKTYDEASSLSPEAPAAYVDFVGRPALTAAVHNACGDALKRSLVIGMTDWEADRTPSGTLAGPQPEFFFVPTYAAERAKALGPEKLGAMTREAMVSFYPVSRNFVTPETVTGQAAIDAAWQASAAGEVAPDRGLICQL
ncbi:DUF2855 family protein [Henriciella litoralis]|uniref:DUF2855 family protein n=1 Tax=Henriciella litoralis TaxID=568102 RepID=UPI000A029BFA|nr:DUF2855 family protein [Henriciella litoralis]